MTDACKTQTDCESVTMFILMEHNRLDNTRAWVRIPVMAGSLLCVLAPRFNPSSNQKGALTYSNDTD